MFILRIQFQCNAEDSSRKKVLHCEIIVEREMEGDARRSQVQAASPQISEFQFPIKYSVI